MTVPDLIPAWRALATQIDPFNPGAATAYRRAADALEAELRAQADAAKSQENEALTLAEAAMESGLSADHLRHLLASGKLPNAGARRRPRVRRGDLPRRGARSPVKAGAYDVDADARALLGRTVRPS